MSTDGAAIEPLLSAGEREELGHLDYFDRRLAELRDRGLFAPVSYAAVVAEARQRRESIARQGH
jgi:hypothetical protein